MNNQTLSRRHARHAFSLIELSLVVLIMGILAGVAVVAIGPKIFKAKTQVTKTNMLSINNSLKEYHATNNSYPPSLAQLVPNYFEKLPKDGWKREFYYSSPGINNHPYEIRSMGDDGLPSTPDDLDLWIVIEEE